MMVNRVSYVPLADLSALVGQKILETLTPTKMDSLDGITALGWGGLIFMLPAALLESYIIVKGLKCITEEDHEEEPRFAI